MPFQRIVIFFHKEEKNCASRLGISFVFYLVYVQKIRSFTSLSVSLEATFSLPFSFSTQLLTDLFYVVTLFFAVPQVVLKPANLIISRWLFC